MRISRLRNLVPCSIMTAVFLFANPLSAMESVYKNRTSGDLAFQNGDYPVAASFYAKYREEAEKNQDPEAECDACERQIDALILGEMPGVAAKALSDYKNKYGGKKPISVLMWEADILLLEQKPAEAIRILKRLIPGLTPGDASALRPLSSLAKAQEQIGDFKSAAETYREIRRIGGTSKLAKTALERQILCLTASGDANAALNELMTTPVPENDSERELQRLIALYVTLKLDGAAAVTASWKGAVADLQKRPRSSAFPGGYAFLSAIGDEFVRLRDYAQAREAYHFAFLFAPTKNTAFQTMQRLISVLDLEKNPAAAAQLAKKSLDLFQTSYATPEIKFKTAGIFWKAGMLAEAEQLYRNIISNPASTAAIRMDAVRACARTLSDMRKYDAIEPLLNQSLTTPEQREAGRFLLADLLFRRGEYKKAADLFRSAATQYPASSAKAFYLAAEAYLAANLPAEAMTCAEHLAGMDKNPEAMANALYLKGRIFDASGKLSESINSYLSYSELPNARPDLAAEALFKAGKMSFLQQNPVRAEELFDKLLRMFPNQALAPSAAFWRIYSFKSHGNEVAAERATWLLVEKYPNSKYAIRALFSLAGHYMDSGLTAKANDVLDDLLKRVNSRDLKAKVIVEKASIAVKSGETERALGFLSEIARLYADTPAMAEACYLHGDILRRQGNFEQAISYYDKVLRLRPDSLLELATLGSIGDCTFALAGLKNSTEKYREALDVYRRILSARDLPDTIRITTLYKSGRCSQLAEREDLAMRYYKEALYMLRPDAGSFERLWATKAAESIISLAEKRPLRIYIDAARKALRKLSECGVIERNVEAERMHKLEKLRVRTI